jgi:hypothetical protein
MEEKLDPKVLVLEYPPFHDPLRQLRRFRVGDRRTPRASFVSTAFNPCNIVKIFLTLRSSVDAFGDEDSTI